MPHTKKFLWLSQSCDRMKRKCYVIFRLIYVFEVIFPAWCILSPTNAMVMAITEMMAAPMKAEWKPPFIASIDITPIFSRVSV